MAELTHDTTDDGFHEIQLSGKQLVFLFMLTTGVLVLVFLLGVQVGRDVRAERGGDSADAVPVATAATGDQVSAPGESPAPVSEGQLSYPRRLDAPNPPAETLKPKAADPEPAQSKSEPPQPAPEPPAARQPAAATATPPPAAPTRTRSAAVPTSGRSGRWVVQVITLSDRAGAAEFTQGLIAEGYPAFLQLPPPGTPALYRVQIGRYNDRAEADRVARRLVREKGYKPEVKR